MKPGVGQRRDLLLDQGPSGQLGKGKTTCKGLKGGAWQVGTVFSEEPDSLMRPLSKPHSVPLHSAFFSLFNLGPSALVCVCRRCTQTRSLGAIQSLFQWIS